MRPFLHVSDAAAAMILCLELQTDLVSGEIFNVGADEQNFTICQVANLVQDRIPGPTSVRGALRTRVITGCRSTRSTVNSASSASAAS